VKLALSVILVSVILGGAWAFGFASGQRVGELELERVDNLADRLSRVGLHFSERITQIERNQRQIETNVKRIETLEAEVLDMRSDVEWIERHLTDPPPQGAKP